jgi:hypothetical protein
MRDLPTQPPEIISFQFDSQNEPEGVNNMDAPGRAPKPETKLFGRFHGIALLLLGFLLTGVVGAWLQSRYAAAQARAAVVETQRSAATEVFSEVSRLLDRRLFHAEVMLDAARSNKRFVRDSTQREYRTVLVEWRGSFNRNRAMICRYFGFGPSSDYYYISNQLGRSDRVLLHGVRPDSAGFGDIDSLQFHLRTLQGRALRLNDALIEKIRRGHVADAIAGDTLDAKCSRLGEDL